LKVREGQQFFAQSFGNGEMRAAVERGGIMVLGG